MARIIKDNFSFRETKVASESHTASKRENKSYYEEIHAKMMAIADATMSCCSKKRWNENAHAIMELGSEVYEFSSNCEPSDIASKNLLSGIFATVGSAIIAYYDENSSILEQQKTEYYQQAKTYLVKAFTLNKSNMNARIYLFHCLLELHEYKDALITLEKFIAVRDYETEQYQVLLLVLNTSIDKLIQTTSDDARTQSGVIRQIIEAYYDALKELEYYAESYELEFDMYGRKLPLYYEIIEGDKAQALICYKKAYKIYSEHDELHNEKKEASILVNMANCIRFTLRSLEDRGEAVVHKRLEEARSYIEKAYEICNEKNLNKHEKNSLYTEYASDLIGRPYIEKANETYNGEKLNKYEKISLYTEYASILTELKEFGKAEDILKSIVDKHPSDQVFYSYADCLYRQGKHEEAFSWAQKALFIVEDDINIKLNAFICKELSKYEEAYELYKKLLAFYMDGSHTYITYKDPDGEEVRSIAMKHDSGKIINHIYAELLKILHHLHNYQDARIYLTLAEEEFPKDNRWEVWESVLPSLVISQQQLDATKHDLEESRKELMAQKSTVREWAKKLIELQENSDGLDMDKASDWGQFEKKINKIIDDLNEQTKQNGKMLSETTSRIHNDFPYLDPKAQEFLVTAETLYQQHKSSEIDFAAIVVEYCKVLETQLRHLLGDRLPSNVKMLGNIIGCIADNSISPYNRYCDQLWTINSYRCSSAHTGKLRKKDADDIRRIYYDLGLLQHLK